MTSFRTSDASLYLYINLQNMHYKLYNFQVSVFQLVNYSTITHFTQWILLDVKYYIAVQITIHSLGNLNTIFSDKTKSFKKIWEIVKRRATFNNENLMEVEEMLITEPEFKLFSFQLRFNPSIQAYQNVIRYKSLENILIYQM